MLSLDLFDSRYERDLREGAVDDLEARRIDDLNMRMLELLDRAKEPAYRKNPGALAGLKKQFQKIKDERDSYYKVREAGIPGNIPVEKIPGKEDLLKGRGRTYYEGHPVTEISDQTVQNYKEKAWDQFAQGKDRRGAGIGRALDKQRGAFGHVKTTDQKKNSEAVDEGQVSDEVDHRGDVDTKANIEVPGVDLKNDTFKITYNGKPYQVKIQNFSQEDLGRWQIADYDVDIINSKGKKVIIDWDKDRQVTMVNTIIAYLDTQQASDIQLMAWRQAGIENSTAEELYQEIQDFYKNDQQKIDKATAWLAQNMEDTDQRQVFADYVKNPVSRPVRTKYIPKEYLMYVAFSYSREGNTELTPGMNLKPIQLDDPDDEEEFYRKVDELFRKVQFKFDAFENKIVELADSYGLGSDPDLGSGFGQRELVWDHKQMTTSSSESNLNRQQILAKAILNFQAEVKKYVESFNNTLIKIGLPGIGEYSTWSGVLGDQLTDQQVRYFDTPEGFANLASGKVDLAKMLDDNVEKLGLKETGNPTLGEKKLGQLRPTLGTGRDIGKSVKKFRAQRGLDEKETGPLDQKLQRLKVQARRQFPRAHTDDEALVLKLLDKETQDDRENRRVDARQDAELAKNFALDREQDDDIDRLQAGSGMQEHGGGIGPKQRWQDLMPEQMNPEDYEDEDEDEDLRLRSGDYVRDTQDGESGEIFRMQGDPYERRVRILDRDGKGWYIEPSRLTRVDPTDPDVQRYFGRNRVRDMDEMDKSQPSQERHGDRPLGAKGTTATPVAARKVVKDLAMDLDQAFAKQKPVKKKGVAEARPITSAGDTTAGAKKLWQYIGRNLEDLASNADFDAERNELYINDRLNNLFKTADGQPVQVAFDMGSDIVLDKGILYIPIGTIWQYRGMYTAEKFITDVVKALSGRAVKEGWSDAMVARRTGQPRTPYSVYIKGKKWKDFENDDHARAVMDKLKAKFRADGRDPETITIAPTDMSKGVTEDQDTSGVEQAILKRIMVAHLDLLRQYGPEKVMQAAEEVAYNVGDVDEIGTSDVSAYVQQVKQILGAVA